MTAMADGTLHLIEDDLSETWFEEWTQSGVASSRTTSPSTSRS